jgi:hypothetical protein
MCTGFTSLLSGLLLPLRMVANGSASVGAMDALAEARQTWVDDLAHVEADKRNQMPTAAPPQRLIQWGWHNACGVGTTNVQQHAEQRP